MTMTPFNSDMKQALKWMQNNAPRIQSLISQKSDWYSQLHDSFWSDWTNTIFDLRTAAPFGIMVWCIILGVPSSLFGLYPEGQTSWAYGNKRNNYVYSGTDPSLPNPNMDGGNFFGGGNTTILNIQEARWMLMLRYAALVSNGRISFINRMLKFIFNEDAAWDFANKKYFYATDSTSPAQALTDTAPVSGAFKIEYRIGANFPVSTQFINSLNDPRYGLVPVPAGCSYVVIQEA